MGSRDEGVSHSVGSCAGLCAQGNGCVLLEFFLERGGSRALSIGSRRVYVGMDMGIQLLVLEVCYYMLC